MLFSKYLPNSSCSDKNSPSLLVCHNSAAMSRDARGKPHISAENMLKVDQSLGYDAQDNETCSASAFATQNEGSTFCEHPSGDNKYGNNGDNDGDDNNNSDDDDDDFVLEEEERRHTGQTAQTSNTVTPHSFKQDCEKNGGRVCGEHPCFTLGQLRRPSASQDRLLPIVPVTESSAAVVAATVATKTCEWDDTSMHSSENHHSLSVKSPPFVCAPALSVSVVSHNFWTIFDPDEDELELTGSALDEPMTPQNYSSMRFQSEMKKCSRTGGSVAVGNNIIGNNGSSSGGCGYNSMLSLRDSKGIGGVVGGVIPSSSPSFQCSSSNSPHHLRGLRRSEPLLSEASFYTREARRPPLALGTHSCTDSLHDVVAPPAMQSPATPQTSGGDHSLPTFSAQNLHDARGACGRRSESTCPQRSSCLPPEPKDITSVNAGRLRSISFMNTVVMSSYVDKHVVSNHQKLLNEKYVIYPKWSLGVGSYSKVVLCYNLEDKVYYAMKVLDRVKLHRKGLGVDCALHKVKCEIAIMKKLRHQNIVALVEVIDDPRSRKIYLILELAEHGEIMSLRDDGTVVSTDDNAALSEREVVRVMRSIVNAVKYAHHLGIAHRDIKPQNILLTAEGDVKLSDFGVSIIVDDSAVRVRREGSVAFLPPEMLVSPEVKVAPPAMRFSSGSNNTPGPGSGSGGAAGGGGGGGGSSSSRSSSSSSKLHFTVAPSSSSITSSTTATPIIPGMEERRKSETHVMTKEAASKVSDKTAQMCRSSNAVKTLPEPTVLVHPASAPAFATTCSTLGNAQFSVLSHQAAPQVDLFKADVFSLGVTAFVLLMRRLPWRARDALSQLNAILTQPDPFEEEFRQVYGNSASDAQNPPFLKANGSESFALDTERARVGGSSIHLEAHSQVNTAAGGSQYSCEKVWDSLPPPQCLGLPGGSTHHKTAISRVKGHGPDVALDDTCPLAEHLAPFQHAESSMDDNDDTQANPENPAAKERKAVFTTSFESTERVQSDKVKISQSLPKTATHGFISAEAIDFIRCCLKVDPTERSTMDELYNHPWIQALIASEGGGEGVTEMIPPHLHHNDALRTASGGNSVAEEERVCASSAALDQMKSVTKTRKKMKDDEEEAKDNDEEQKEEVVEKESGKKELGEMGNKRLTAVAANGDGNDKKDDARVESASRLRMTHDLCTHFLDPLALQSMESQMSPPRQDDANAAVTPVFGRGVQSTPMRSMSPGTLTISALTSLTSDTCEHPRQEDIVPRNGSCKTLSVDKISFTSDVRSLHTEASPSPLDLPVPPDLSEDVDKFADAVTPATNRPRRLTNSEEVAVPMDLVSKLLGRISARLRPFRRHHFDEDPSFRYSMDDNCMTLRGSSNRHPTTSSPTLKNRCEKVGRGRLGGLDGKDEHVLRSLTASAVERRRGDTFLVNTSLTRSLLRFAPGRKRQRHRYHGRSFSCPE